MKLFTVCFRKRTVGFYFVRTVIVKARARGERTLAADYDGWLKHVFNWRWEFRTEMSSSKNSLNPSRRDLFFPKQFYFCQSTVNVFGTISVVSVAGTFWFCSRPSHVTAPSSCIIRVYSLAVIRTGHAPCWIE